jgi:hypothetical protein
MKFRLAKSTVPVVGRFIHSFVIYGLGNDYVSSSDYVVSSHELTRKRLILEGCGRIRSQPNLKYYSGFCWRERRNPHKP